MNINFLYIALALIFVAVITYMFLYTTRLNTKQITLKMKGRLSPHEGATPMSQIAEVQLVPLALAANMLLIPIEKHVHFVYIGLATIFVCVLIYWFVYTKRH